MNGAFSLRSFFLLTTFIVSVESLLADATTDIIRQMTYGTRPSSGPPVVAPGIPIPTPPVTLPGNYPIIINSPSYGWGGYGWGWNNNGYWGNRYYNGWGYDYSSGYYNGALQAENQFLRQRVEEAENQRLREQWQEEEAAIGQQRQFQRERADRNRSENAQRTGLRLFKKGSWNQAIQRFRQAAELDPTSAPPAFYLAQAQFSAGNYREAASAIREGLVRDSAWPTHRVDVRAMYGDPADLTQEMGELAKHLKLRPNDADALYVLAFELFVTGESDKARVLFEQVAKLSPADEHIVPFLDVLGVQPKVANAPPPRPAAQPPKDPPAIPVPNLLEDSALGNTDS